jgi:hypothetical protein
VYKILHIGLKTTTRWKQIFLCNTSTVQSLSNYEARATEVNKLENLKTNRLAHINEICTRDHPNRTVPI